MKLSFANFNGLAFVIPYILVIVIAVRFQRKATAKAERNGGMDPPFAPEYLPPSEFLLGHFRTPERAYLLQRKQALRWLACIYLYAFLIMTCENLLPEFIAQSGIAGGGPLSIWHSYLAGITQARHIYVLFSFIGGSIASAEISLRSTAVFPRTRPISHRLIFWGRIAPSLATLLGAYALAVGISLLVLVLGYGPVYNHLWNAASLPSIIFGQLEIQKVVLTLQTSAPRIFLSSVTTLLLDFSLVVTAFFLPLRNRLSKAVAVGIILFFGVVATSFVNIFHDMHIFPGIIPDISRFLFLYSYLGAPPPYAYATIPIAISIALLTLASFFSERLEI